MAIRRGIVSGGLVGQEMKKHRIFPSLLVRMVSVGEETGRVDDMLVRASRFFRDDDLQQRDSRRRVNLVQRAVSQQRECMVLSRERELNQGMQLPPAEGRRQLPPVSTEHAPGASSRTRFQRPNEA